MAPASASETAPEPVVAEKIKEFYGVLGLKKEECTTGEIRNAYKILAMKWHPDRCSGSGHVKQAEEGKKKFQAIQEAYSVLSNANKRFLYDIGLYDTEDEEDENGMGDFIDEMVAMMCQNKPSENTKESFEELQELFVDAFGSSSSSAFSSSTFTQTCNVHYNDNNKKRDYSQLSLNSSSTFTQTCNVHYNDNNKKRDYSQLSLNSFMVDETNPFQEFHFAVEGGREESSSRNSRRNQKPWMKKMIMEKRL